MIKIILIFIFFNTILVPAWGYEKMPIYRDLCSFLVSENKLQAKDTIGREPLSLLYISNLLDSMGKRVDISDNFGVYKFNKIGLEDNIDYILIKRNDSYIVFKENEPTLIIYHLLSIKEEYPQELSTELCNKYIKKIVDMNMFPVIGTQRGKVLFFDTKR